MSSQQLEAEFFNIPAFLHRKTVRALAEERGCDEGQAMNMLFARDYKGVPFPRIRTRQVPAS